MRIKWLHFKIPRRDVEMFVDLMECNNLPCEVVNAGITDPRFAGPRVIHVAVPEDELEDSDDVMCDKCMGWNDEHVEECPEFLPTIEFTPTGSLPPESN